ncbi:MAG: hypothetical protein AAF752_08250, partial [Bacteroidota bacterium]
VLFLGLIGIVSAQTPALEPQDSGSEQLFIAVSAPDAETAWIAGTSGTFGRTVDGGATWMLSTVPGADSLQFRDVHAVDANQAYLLSIGTGTDSRVYKTNDAGTTWSLVYTNDEAEGFLDCMDFWDADHGLVYGDNVGGRLTLLTTDDGGMTWRRVPGEALPPALDSEGGFAASGTCVHTMGNAEAWVALGNAAEGRLLHTMDRGVSWAVYTSPIVAHAEGAGHTAVTFRDDLNGVAVGGDLTKPDAFTQNVVRTTDGGRTWTAGGTLAFAGAAYGAAYVPGQPSAVVATGPNGLSLSTDDGQTWSLLDDKNYWGIGFSPAGNGWAVGRDGRITAIRFGE